jgi:hypothetical protein
MIPLDHSMSKTLSTRHGGSEVHGRRLLTAGIAAAALTGAAVLTAAPASAAQATCSTWTQGDQAFAFCVVSSGQVRVRADCAYAPDTYSPWVGEGAWNLWTGHCLFSVRGAIIEER